MTKNILLVCLGNICRSPAAEGVLRAKARTRGMKLYIDSAGTGAWHEGDPPDGRMIKAAGKRGYDIAQQRALITCSPWIYRTIRICWKWRRQTGLATFDCFLILHPARRARRRTPIMAATRVLTRFSI